MAEMTDDAIQRIVDDYREARGRNPNQHATNQLENRSATALGFFA